MYPGISLILIATMQSYLGHSGKVCFSQLLSMWFLPFVGAGVNLSTGSLNPKEMYHEYKNSGNATIFRKYRSLSNLVHRATCQDKARHSDAVTQQCHSNPRQFWKWINSLKGHHCPVPPLYDSGIVLLRILIRPHYLIAIVALSLQKRIVPTFIS